MGLYVIQYRYPSNLKFMVEDFRPAHRTFMRKMEADGTLKAAGFLGDAVFEGGMMIVEAPSAQAAEKLLVGDAFYDNGLMEELIIRAWTPTVGMGARGFATSFPIS